VNHAALKHFSLALCLAAAFLPEVLLAQNAAPIPTAVQRHLLTDPGTPALGSASAEITVVNYFDYNCPFCRELAPAFHAFTAADHTVAVIYKERPVFGGVLVYAARSALAADFQGKYLQAHDALISAPRLAPIEQVEETLRRAGIDMSQLVRDARRHAAAIDALLARNESEACSLGLRGTPGVLVDRTVVKANLIDLQAAVTTARHARASRSNR